MQVRLLQANGPIVDLPADEARRLIQIGAAEIVTSDVERVIMETAALTPDGGRMQSRVRPLPSASCRRKPS